MQNLGDNVSIKIQIGLYSTFRHLNNKPWYALSEFVDNAVQSYLDNKTELNKLHKNLENNIFQSGSMYFDGNNGAAIIAYNTFINYSNLDDSDAPISLGDIITTNANGHAADTYLNIFEMPLFFPSDSTVKMSYEIIDSVMYLTATPGSSWEGELSNVHWRIWTDYDDYYNCCNYTYLYRELIDNQGRSWISRNQNPSLSLLKKNKDISGPNINEYSIQDYEEITPNSRRIGFYHDNENSTNNKKKISK